MFSWLRPAVLIASILVIGFAGRLSGQAPSQPEASLSAAQRQIQQGDPFGAILVLNDVVAQNAGNSRLVARAHAARAMAFLALGQPERAQAAVAAAVAAEPGFQPASSEVNAATVAIFSAASATSDPFVEAVAAEKTGNHQAAFLGYVRAYQALPAGTPPIEERLLRERVIRAASRLTTAPIVPAQAAEHVRKADQWIEAEGVLGDTSGASARSAESEVWLAIRIAPWWGEATLKLARLLQRQQRGEEALANVSLYRLAAPKGYAAATAAAALPPAATAPASAAAPKAAVTGTATIIVIRASNFVGSASRMDVDCNGQRIAELQNGRVLRFTAPAGKVRLHFQNDDPIEIEASPGSEHYFRAGPGMAGFNTKALSVAEGKEHLKEKNPRPNDPKRTTTTECKSLMP